MTLLNILFKIGASTFNIFFFCDKFNSACRFLWTFSVLKCIEPMYEITEFKLCIHIFFRSSLHENQWLRIVCALSNHFGIISIKYYNMVSDRCCQNTKY